MPFIPDDFDEIVSMLNWSRSQKIAYTTLWYLILAIYGSLILLALRNIWAILLKQREYKNLPILAYYAFALIAVSLRLVYVIGYWTGAPVLLSIDWVQQGAKLGVGIV